MRGSVTSLVSPSDQMNIGELYAATVKTIAMGLMYGVLYPPAYILCAAALLMAYIGTRFGLAFWYTIRPTLYRLLGIRVDLMDSCCGCRWRRPPNVDTAMLDELISRVAFVQASTHARLPLARRVPTHSMLDLLVNCRACP